MSDRGKLMRGGVQLLGGHGAMQVIALLRNFCIARLISPEDFGIAATFALTFSILEAVGDLSFDKLLIQDRDGDKPHLQAVLQALTLIRGLVIGAAIFLLAEPIARIFDVPDAEAAYRWLALAPVLKGLAHLDFKRMQRQLHFSTELRLFIAAQVAAFVVAVGLAWIWRDYMAVLWGVIAQAAVQGLGAHLLAERPYRLALRGPEIRKALQFGWPLMLNGIILILAAQGDRALIGAELGMTDLAIYTVAAMLIGALQLPLLRVIGGLTMPWLASVQGEPSLTERYQFTSDGMAMTALFVFLPLALIGNELIGLVFGASYVGPAAVVAWLAFGAALRLLQGAPTTASLAAGDSRNLMLSNMARTTGILAAVLVLKLGGGLVAVAAAMCLGEFLGWVAALLRLKRVLPSGASPAHVSGVVCSGVFVVALVFITALPEAELAVRIIVAGLLTVSATILLLWLSPHLLRLAASLSRSLYRARWG